MHNDPLEVLKNVRVPVLILFGDDDGAIDLHGTLPGIENALDSTRHEIKIFDDLGHLFMRSRGVPAQELKKAEETIAPEVLETIYHWVSQI